MRALTAAHAQDFSLYIFNVVVAVLEVDLLSLLAATYLELTLFTDMFDGNHFTSCLFDCLVDNAEATTYALLNL